MKGGNGKKGKGFLVSLLAHLKNKEFSRRTMLYLFLAGSILLVILSPRLLAGSGANEVFNSDKLTPTSPPPTWFPPPPPRTTMPPRTKTPDPCANVQCVQGLVCERVNLVTYSCVNGNCIPKVVEANSSRCGGTAGVNPCDGVICNPPTKCYGFDLYKVECMGGHCLTTNLLEKNSTTCGYDPCDGVICTTSCNGYDLYSTYCDEGHCQENRLIAESSPECGADLYRQCFGSLLFFPTLLLIVEIYFRSRKAPKL